MSDNGTSSLTPLFAFRELEHGTECWHRRFLIGAGRSGEVFRCQLPDGTNVAVKKLHIDRHRASPEELQRELSSLHAHRHPHIVPLLGWCTSQSGRAQELGASVSEQICVVYELMYDLSVHGLLHSHPDSSWHMPWLLKLKIAVQSVRALAFLHHRNVDHRDVKTANLLVEDSPFWKKKVGNDLSFARVRLADLGMACRSTTDLQAVVGTTGYLPPEERADDVYSFGVVLIELLVEKLPTREDVVGYLEDVLSGVHGISGLDPHKQRQSASVRWPVDILQAYVEVARSCVRREKHLRPAIQDVCNTLNDLWSKATGQSLLETVRRQRSVQDVCTGFESKLGLKNNTASTQALRDTPASSSAWETVASNRASTDILRRFPGTATGIMSAYYAASDGFCSVYFVVRDVDAKRDHVVRVEIPLPGADGYDGCSARKEIVTRDIELGCYSVMDVIAASPPPGSEDERGGSPSREVVYLLQEERGVDSSTSRVWKYDRRVRSFAPLLTLPSKCSNILWCDERGDELLLMSCGDATTITCFSIQTGDAAYHPLTLWTTPVQPIGLMGVRVSVDDGTAASARGAVLVHEKVGSVEQIAALELSYENASGGGIGARSGRGSSASGSIKAQYLCRVTSPRVVAAVPMSGDTILLLRSDGRLGTLTLAKRHLLWHPAESLVLPDGFGDVSSGCLRRMGVSSMEIAVIVSDSVDVLFKVVNLNDLQP